ncbi:MAG: peptide chain release factor N(5)-glutamine methyltransferase [Bacteroidales bacterium]
MWDVQKLKQALLSALGSSFESSEARNMVRWLLTSFAGLKPEDVVMNPDLMVDDAVVSRLFAAVGELKKDTPIQYVTGKAYFYGLELNVNRDVLIPRPETEEMVQWVLENFSRRPGMRVLDIGTGSGCIILALGSFLTDPVLQALDNSPEALAVASGNASQLKLKIDFHRVDIRNRGEWDDFGKFDLIVSNPPYVREIEKPAMKRNVLDYEPAGALFVPDDDPLIYYHAIAGFSRYNLSEEGALFVEINENFGRETVNLFRDHGFTKVELRKDIRNKDRMIMACF